MVKRWVIAQPTSYSGVAMYPASEVQTCGPEYVLASDYDALAARLAVLERGGLCVWCGESWDLTGATMEHAVDVMQKHDAKCEHNPLRARLAEAERDAARYRWLRDNAKRTMLIRLPASYEPDDIDRTIDAAMQSETVDESHDR